MRESLIIQKIRAKLQARKLRDYLGDDAAVIPKDSSKRLICSQDSLVESVHFNLESIYPEELGWKSLAVNISDLAAMAAIPRFAFLSLSFPEKLSDRWLERFIDGFLDCAQRAEISLAGGDLTRADRLFVSVCLLGEENSAQKIALRSNAQANQSIYLSGQFGYSAAGFDLVRKFKREFPKSIDLKNLKDLKDLVEKHFRPAIRVKEALELVDLAQTSTPAIIDSSDGLLDSLERISRESQVRLELSLDSLLDQKLMQAAAILAPDKSKESQIQQVLNWILVGGEDYELVATAERDLVFEKKSNWQKIGKVLSKVENTGSELSLKYQGKKIELKEFKKFVHFTETEANEKGNR